MKMIKAVISLCFLSGFIRIAQTCSYDHDCRHHWNSCQSGHVYCYRQKCHCGSSGSTHSSCQTSSDCSHHPCSSPLSPYCYHSQEHGSSCACQECTHDEDCACADEMETLDCYYIHDDHHHHHSHDRKCQCRHPSTTTAAIDSTKAIITGMPTPSIAAGITGSTKASMLCQHHADCFDHTCPADHHPYCRFGDHSTSCDCTVCTDDSHCTHCSSGRIGRCGFDLTTRNHSCDCDLPNSTPTSMTPTSTSQSIKLSTTLTPTSQSTESPTTNTIGQVSRQCHVCGNSSNSISCDTRTVYLGNLQTCPRGEDFCMTDIVHNGQATPNIYKRCVTEHECRNKWLQQTSDLEYCMKYGDVPMTGPYSCHFCCVADGCNAGLIPDKSTYYSKA